MKKIRGLIVGKFADEEVSIIKQELEQRSCSKIRFQNNHDLKTLLRKSKRVQYIVCTLAIYEEFVKLFKQCRNNKKICVVTKENQQISLAPKISQFYIDKKLKALACVPHKQL